MEIIISIVIAFALFTMLFTVLTAFACFKASVEADEFAEREYKRLMAERNNSINKGENKCTM